MPSAQSRAIGRTRSALRLRAAPAALSARLVVILAIASVVLTVTGPGTLAATSVRYVATNGSDGNPGTLSRPWRSIAHGLDAVGPGDTLIIRGGTYRERIKETLTPGRRDARIRAEAYRGERPVIMGLLWLTGASYWTFDGLNVTWDPNTGDNDEHMVKLTNGVGWVFRNAEIWGARSFAGLLVAGTVQGQPANWTVSHNCIHDTYPSNGTHEDHNLYVNTGTSSGSGLIERNLFFNATNGSNIKLGGPSSSSGGAGNVAIRYNTLYNAAQNLVAVWRAHDNVIFRNILGRLSSTTSGYGNIRGYQLSGSGNLALANVGFQADRFIFNDSLSDPGVRDGGGNVYPRNPDFDSVGTCRGFHPADSPARAYGRWAPVAAISPAVELAAPAALVSGVPAGIAWSASTPGPSVASFRLEVSRDGGAYVGVSLPAPLTRSIVRSLSSGHRYRYRVRATDATGRTSAWAYAPAVTATLFQEGNSAVGYSGTWSRDTSTAFSGGSARYATRYGAEASFRVTSRGFAWVAARGPSRGSAQVYVGSLRVATVNLYASSFQPGRVVLALDWPGSATRTVTVRVLGTSGHPRVDVDGFVLLK